MTLVTTPANTQTMLPIIKANDLGEGKPIEVPWIVEGIVAHGTITELIGETYKGKTTLIGCMVRSILMGTAFLGHEVEKAKVLWLTEQSDETFIPLLTQVGIYGKPIGDILDTLKIRSFDESLPTWDDLIRDIRKVCRDQDIGLVIFDVLPTWAQITNNDDPAEWIRKLRPQQLLAGDGPGILNVRHPRKAGGKLANMGAGAHSLSGGVDITFAMDNAKKTDPQNDRVLRGKGRLPGIPSYMHVTTNSDYSEYSLRSTTQPVPVVKDNQKTIREALKKAGKGLSKRELTERTKISASTVKRTLDTMKGELTIGKRKAANHIQEDIYSIPGSTTTANP